MKRKVASLVIFLTVALCSFAAKRSSYVLSDTLKYQRDSLFIEGIRLRALNLSDSAKSVFLKASLIDPDNSAINYELGLAFVYSDIKSSVAYLQKAVEGSKDNYYYRKSLINAYLLDKNYEAAQQEYEDILKKYPDHESDYIFLADLYAKTSNYKKAINTYERLERIMGTDRYISMRKVSVYLIMKDTKSAHKILDKLIKEYPLDAALWTYKGDIYTESKDMEKAEMCIAMSESIDPENGYTLESKYYYYVKNGDKEKADQMLKKILSSDDIPFEDKNRYLTQQVRYYTYLGKPISEIDSLYACLMRSEVDNPDAYIEYARLLKTENRIDDAIEAVRTAVYLSPKEEKYWLYLFSIIDGRTELYEKTIQDANDAIPESLTFMLLSGMWNYNLGHADEALEKLLKVDSIGTASPALFDKENKKNAWSCLFEIYYNANDSANCYKYLQKLVDEFPDDVNTLNSYAYILAIDNKDIEKALKMSKKTIDKEPLNPAFLDTYAYILMKKGNYPHARFYIEQAIEYMRDNLDATIYEHYGDILYLFGDVENAVTQWKKAESLNQEDRVTPMLKTKIEKKKYVE